MSDFEPDKIYNAIIAAGEKWVDAEAAAELLEETRKVVLAKLMETAQAMSNAERERMALANPAFTEHVEKMVQARQAANLARVRYDAVRVLAEMRRSQESTRRAEITLK